MTASPKWESGDERCVCSVGTKGMVEGEREQLETRNWKLEIGKAESGHDPDRRRAGGTKARGETRLPGMQIVLIRHAWQPH